MRHRKIAAILTTMAIAAGAMTISASAPYTDIKGSSAKMAIDYLYDSHCLTNFQEPAFHPEQSLTRGDLAQMMYGVMANFQKDRITYSDVGSIKDMDAVSAVTELKIMNSYPDGTFRPDETVTREAFAVAVYNYLKYYQMAEPDGKTADYTDEAAISPWAKTAVDVLHSKKIVPSDRNFFHPQQSVTREEAAAIFYGLMKSDGAYVSHVAVEAAVLKCITAEYASPVAYFKTGTLYWQGDTLILGMKQGPSQWFVKRLKAANLPAGSVDIRHASYSRSEYAMMANRAIRILVKKDSLSNYIGYLPDYGKEQIILTVRHKPDPAVQQELDSQLGAGRVRIEYQGKLEQARKNM